MKPTDLVNCIRREVLEQNMSHYDRLHSLQASAVRDGRWQRIAASYSKMDTEQRLAIRLTIEQAMIDAISNILGILDGSSILEKHRDYFTLTYGESKSQLNGELQERFLASLEDEPLTTDIP
jgi:hypothetical protein